MAADMQDEQAIVLDMGSSHGVKDMTIFACLVADRLNRFCWAPI